MKAILKRLEWLEKENDIESRRHKLPQKEIELAEKSKASLYLFAQQSWPSIEGNREFQGNWHIEAICEHLEAVYHGQIRNLLINLPPRCMKSSLVAVIWPSWCWINDPSLQFLFTSYAQSLSIRDSVKCRRLIESPWFQSRYGHLFRLASDVNTKLRFDNDKTGYRIASSVGGSNTGEGGDILVADDPNNAKDGESEVTREGTNDWWDTVMSTRLNNPRTGRKVIVQQRIHESDLSGHILSKKDPALLHLMLPMEFEIKRRSVTVPLKSTNKRKWQDPRKKEGDLLWNTRINRKELDSLKRSLGSEYTIAGQLQQRPAPAQGGIIKKSWFKVWEYGEPPQCEQIIQSWDTALSESDKAGYSACTTWGLFTDETGLPNIVLLSLWRGRVEYPDLRQMAQRLAHNYYDNILKEPLGYGGPKPDVILVEAKVSGISLIQDLSRAGVITNRFDPTRYGDKLQRVRLVTHLLEAGRVWVPGQPPLFNKLRSYADLFVEQCGSFPNAESRDLVDTMTQVLLRLTSTGWIYHQDDPRPPVSYQTTEGVY